MIYSSYFFNIFILTLYSEVIETTQLARLFGFLLPLFILALCLGVRKMTHKMFFGCPILQRENSTAFVLIIEILSKTYMYGLSQNMGNYTFWRLKISFLRTKVMFRVLLFLQLRYLNAVMRYFRWRDLKAQNLDVNLVVQKHSYLKFGRTAHTSYWRIIVKGRLLYLKSYLCE